MTHDDHPRRLVDQYAYLRLITALEPGRGGWRDPETMQMLASLSEFIATASALDQFKTHEVETTLRAMCESHQARMPPRKDRREIGRDFLNLGGTAPDIWRFGVEYAWLAERFETPAIALPFELPLHARVGIGQHAGNAAIEESNLLDDAYLLRSLARHAYRQMWNSAQGLKAASIAEEARARHRALTPLNMNVATFGRLGVVCVL